LFKYDFKNKCEKDLEEVKKALDESIKNMRRERIRDTESESEESEEEPENIFEEEEEIPKIVKKSKKSKKQVPKPRGRPPKNKS
jgi:hypothetical protein